MAIRPAAPRAPWSGLGRRLGLDSAGSRKPGETIEACAVRELCEETGLVSRPFPVLVEDTDWAVFALEVPWGTEIAVDGTEHDQYEWASSAQALARCRPRAILDAFTAGRAALGSSQ